MADEWTNWKKLTLINFIIDKCKLLISLLWGGENDSREIESQSVLLHE